jgi:hypothetical protein
MNLGLQGNLNLNFWGLHPVASVTMTYQASPPKTSREKEEKKKKKKIHTHTTAS